MYNIKIWDRAEKLKGLEPNVWLNSYPQAALKTLVLVDNTTVYFLEDIKEQGFTGDTDSDVVNAFLKHKEESKKQEKEQKTLEEIIAEKVNEAKLENSLAITELIEKVEKDKLELATAIIEAIEMQNGGGTI